MVAKNIDIFYEYSRLNNLSGSIKMSKKIKPVSRIIKIEAEINKIAGEVFLKKKDLLGLDESWVPCVDVAENETDITVEVELPNVVHLEKTRALLENGVLTIQFKKVRRKQDRQVVLKIRKPEEKTEEIDGEKRR